MGSAAAPHPRVAPPPRRGTARGAACYAHGQPVQGMIEAAETALREGRTHWRREAAERVAFLVDGEAYFAAFRAACLAARHVVRIVGWDIHSRMRLVAGTPPNGLPPELGPLLNAPLPPQPRLGLHHLRRGFPPNLPIHRRSHTPPHLPYQPPPPPPPP